MSRFPAFLKADYPEISSALALQDCHHTVFLDLRLEVAVSGRLLPQRVDLRLTAFFDYLGEARGFDLEKFHCESLDRCRRSDAAYQKEARQRTTARRIILPLLHSCPGGICKSSIHSPLR